MIRWQDDGLTTDFSRRMVLVAVPLVNLKIILRNVRCVDQLGLSV